MNKEDLEKRKKEMEKAGNEYREAVLNRVSILQNEYTNLIKQLELSLKVLEHPQSEINNAGITVNNKIAEISNRFNKAGLSLYSYYHEQYDLITHSFIGDAILVDLIGKLFEANERLKDYSQEVFEIGLKANKKLTSYRKNIFKYIFITLNPFVQINFSLSEEEHQRIDDLFEKYMEVDDKIWKYSLENNLVEALVKAITDEQDFGEYKINYCYDAQDVPYLFADLIIPDLNKLGLESLIPSLQEAIRNKYAQGVDIDKIDEDKRYLYIPDFNRPLEERDITPEEYKELLNEIQTDDNEQEDIYSDVDEPVYRQEVIEGIIVEMNKAGMCPRNAIDSVREKLNNETTYNLEGIFIALVTANQKDKGQSRTRRKGK